MLRTNLKNKHVDSLKKILLSLKGPVLCSWAFFLIIRLSLKIELKPLYTDIEVKILKQSPPAPTPTPTH